MDRARLAALSITALAAWLRFFHLGYHDLRGDEAFSITFAQSQLDSFWQLLRTGEPHPPLYYLSLRLWLDLAGVSELAARWPSAAAGVLACPLTFVAGRRLAGPGLGLLGALLLALNPYHLWNAQDARMYALATFSCLLVLVCALRLQRPGQPAGRDYLALAGASALAFYSHYVAAAVVGAVTLVLLGRLLLARPLSKVALARLVGAQGLALALFLPWLLWGLPTLGPGYTGSFSSPDLAEAATNTLLAFATGEAPPSPANFVLTLALLVAALLGALWLGRRQPWPAALLGAFLLLPFLALFLASRGRAVFSERYLLPVSPALYLFAAAGVQGLLVRSGGLLPAGARRRALGALLLLALLAPLAVPLSGYYADRWGEGPGQWRPFVRRVVALAAPEDLLLVNHIDPSFFYYYRLLGGRAELAVAPSRDGLGEAALAAELAALARPGRTVRFLPDIERLWDREGRVGQWLSQHLPLLGEERVGALPVLTYRLPSALPARVVFGEELNLLGGEVRGGSAGLTGGATVTVDLLWSAQRPPAADYQVSLQLLDAPGALAAQSDGPLGAATAPTSTWRPGQWVVDSHTLRLPSVPGAYTLGVAVYALGDGQRLAVPDVPSGLAPIGRLEIGR